MTAGAAALILFLVAAGAGPPAAEIPGGAGAPPLTVRVTGRDFRWIVRYPGPDGALDTADDVTGERDIHLPAGSRIVLDLRSDDYVYSFLVRNLALSEVAFPGQPWTISFTTRAPERHELLGSQMCGFTHPGLIGEVIVQPPEEFDRWAAAGGARR